MDLTPSQEQKRVYRKSRTHNVIVNSVPGSGKSTTIYSIIAKNLDKSILVLTYNRRLKDTTKEKVIQYFGGEILVPEVHTFHSFCQKTWGVVCKTDHGIVKIIDEKLEPKEDMEYDIVIVDECQDMTQNYNRILGKVVKPETIVIMLGDEMQSIYQFNGSDPRFLTMADRINKISSRPFAKLNLSTSYRLSKPIADFMNNCVVHRELINPSPYKLEGYPKPKYVIDNFFRSEDGLDGIKYVTDSILNFLRLGYKPDDIFILTASVRAPKLGANQKPITKLNPSQHLASALLELQFDGKPIKIFIPDYDDAMMNEEDIEGKIAFCTYHRSKGLERKIVFVLGADISYHEFYDKYSDKNVCPNTIFVALTRSAEHLIILHHFTKDYLPCLNQENIPKYAELIVNKNCSRRRAMSENKDRVISPSVATQHIRNEYIGEMMKMFSTTEARSKQEIINIATKQKEEDNCEQVSEINSYFISLMHKIFITKVKSDDHPLAYRNYIGKFSIADMTDGNCELYDKKVISKLLAYSTKECGINNGYLHKSKQIKRYNWLDAKTIRKLLWRLNKVLSDNCEYEKEVRYPKDGQSATELTTEYVNAKIKGFIDIVDHDKKIIWEIKCTQELKDEHYLQLLIYKYVCHKLGIYMDYRYLLFNIRTGEIHKINATLPEMTQLMGYLVDKKYSPEKENDDDKFISNNLLSSHQ